jgi:hypothetical protein
MSLNTQKGVVNQGNLVDHTGQQVRITYDCCVCGTGLGLATVQIRKEPVL